MKLKFITSISKGYWQGVGKHCISTWDLPGEVEIYIDQQEGEVEWFNELPYKKRLLKVPSLKDSEIKEDEDEEEAKTKTKMRKFWGKACAQIHAVRSREPDTRIIWLDADIEQTKSFEGSAALFDFSFNNPVAMMKSNDWGWDCFETGLVIFNERFEKLDVFIKKYESFWKDKFALKSLHRPYDALVLGTVAESYKGKFYNICNAKVDNRHALANTSFRHHLKHWINKTNKELLKSKISE